MRKIILCIISAVIVTGCGGGGESDTPVVSVSPQSNPAPAAAQDCVNPHTSQYPDLYKGSWPIPEPKQKLDKDILRGVGFKDYNPRIFTPESYTCAKHSYERQMYLDTLNRLQKLNVDVIWIYNYGPWEDMTRNDIWTWRVSDFQISEETIKFVVDEAKKRNIKVYLAYQFNTYDRNGFRRLHEGISVDRDTMELILRTHKAFMIERAKFAEKIGVTGIAADWNAFHISNYRDYYEMWQESHSQTIDAIRENFSGIVTFGQQYYPDYDPRIINKVDKVHVPFYFRLSDVENVNLSVENVRARAEEWLNRMDEVVNNPLDPYHKAKVIFEVQVQSHKDYFIEGWVEDGFCVKGIDKNGKENNCRQETYTTDFSVQAVGIEGILQAIQGQNHFEVEAVNFHTSYWHTDTLEPGRQGFPNLSQSIRGKPAEKIVEHWFSE